MRNLVIIRGRHHSPDGKSEREEIAVKNLEASRCIAETLVVHDRIDRIFGDGINNKVALQWNNYLNRKARFKDSSNPNVQSTVDWLRMTLRCRASGVPIEWCPTESDFLQDRLHGFVYDTLSPSVVIANMFARTIMDILKMKLRGKDLLGAMKSINTKDYLPEDGPLVERAYTRLREWAIYRNISRLGSESNLLWMGRAHPMNDFHRPRSGFSVTGVTIKDDLDFSIDFANRAAPTIDFYRLIERCIEESQSS